LPRERHIVAELDRMAGLRQGLRGDDA
jgi:hypothetical protein